MLQARCAGSKIRGRARCRNPVGMAIDRKTENEGGLMIMKHRVLTIVLSLSLAVVFGAAVKAGARTYVAYITHLDASPF